MPLGERMAMVVLLGLASPLATGVLAGRVHICLICVAHVIRCRQSDVHGLVALCDAVAVLTRSSGRGRRAARVLLRRGRWHAIPPRAGQVTFDLVAWCSMEVPCIHYYQPPPNTVRRTDATDLSGRRYSGMTLLRLLLHACGRVLRGFLLANASCGGNFHSFCCMLSFCLRCCSDRVERL